MCACHFFHYICASLSRLSHLKTEFFILPPSSISFLIFFLKSIVNFMYLFTRGTNKLLVVVVVCQKFVASHLPNCLKLSKNLDVDYGKDDYSLLISLGSSNKLVLFSSFFLYAGGCMGSE